MKKEKISDVIGMIDEKYTDEATSFAAETHTHISNDAQKTSARRVRWGVLAACLALIMITSSAAVAVAAEAREYNAAVTFFEENGLSTPTCGACLSNMAITPGGNVVPCQSWLCGCDLGSFLDRDWEKIWYSGKCENRRYFSALMTGTCPLRIQKGEDDSDKGGSYDK